MPTSVRGQILAAAQTLVQTLDGITDAQNQVVVRKRLAVTKQDNIVDPFVCIAPSGHEHLDGYMSNGEILGYGFLVAVIRAAPLSLAYDDTLPLLSEQIRQKLRTPTLSGVDSVWDCYHLDPAPNCSIEGFDVGMELEVAGYWWKSNELRIQ